LAGKWILFCWKNADSIVHRSDQTPDKWFTSLLLTTMMMTRAILWKDLVVTEQASNRL
jgi:hypothetical protein